MSAEVFDCIPTNNQDKMEQLLAADPGLASARNDQNTSLLMMCLYYRRDNLRDVVLKHHDQIDFFEAAALGRVDVLEGHLKQDPERLRATAADGFTGLHLAVFMGHAPAARFLIDHGAGVAMPAGNPSNVTPLHSAVAGGDVACVQALINAGAPLNDRQAGGFTALMAAAANGRTAIFHALLAAGADATLKDDTGKTAKDHGIEHEHAELVQSLP